jgi:hypothetical protein
VPDFVNIDYFFECGDVESLFGVREKGNGDGNRYTCFSPSSSSSSTALPIVSVKTGQAWRANPFQSGCAQVTTTTTAPAAVPVVDDDNEKNGGGTMAKEDGGESNPVVIAVSTVGALVAAMLLGILWVLHNNNRKNRKKQQQQQQQQQQHQQGQQLPQRGNQNDHDPSHTFIHNSVGGPPAPQDYDYNSFGLPRSTPSGGHTVLVQVAHVISVDVPIQDADPFPKFIFTIADGGGGGDQDDPRASLSNNSNGEDVDDLRVTRNNNRSRNRKVRFRDQTADNPISNERFAPLDRPVRSALSMPRSVASSRGSTTRTTKRSNLPPHLRRKIDEWSNPDRVSGNGIPHSPHRAPAAAVARPVTTTTTTAAAAVPRRPRPTSGVGERVVAGVEFNNNDDNTSRYNTDEVSCQSVIGDVQAVHGLPFIYPGNNKSANVSANNNAKRQQEP